MVKTLPSNAGDIGSISGRGTKIPHTEGRLNLRCNYRAQVPHLERSLRAAARPNAAINK